MKRLASNGPLAVIIGVLSFALFTVAGARQREAPTPTVIVCSMNTFEPMDDPLLGQDKADVSDDCYIDTFTGPQVRVVILD